MVFIWFLIAFNRFSPRLQKAHEFTLNIRPTCSLNSSKFQKYEFKQFQYHVFPLAHRGKNIGTLPINMSVPPEEPGPVVGLIRTSGPSLDHRAASFFLSEEQYVVEGDPMEGFPIWGGRISSFRSSWYVNLYERVKVSSDSKRHPRILS